jgi:hypothetical protein
MEDTNVFFDQDQIAAKHKAKIVQLQKRIMYSYVFLIGIYVLQACLIEEQYGFFDLNLIVYPAAHVALCILIMIGIKQYPVLSVVGGFIVWLIILLGFMVLQKMQLEKVTWSQLLYIGIPYKLCTILAFIRTIQQAKQLQYYKSIALLK